MCGGHSIQKSIFKLIHKLRFLLIFVLYRIFDMSFVHHNIIMVIRLCLYGWGLRFLLLLIAHLSFKFRSFTLEHPYPKFAIWLSCVHPCSSQLFCFYELFLSQSSGKLARLINLLLSNFNFSDFLIKFNIFTNSNKCKNYFVKLAISCCKRFTFVCV